MPETKLKRLFNLLEEILNYQTRQGNKYLSKEDRIVYKLYFYGGWEKEEIAKFLKVSPAKISNLIIELKAIFLYYNGYNPGEIALWLNYRYRYEFERVLEVVKRGLKRRKIGQELKGKWKGIAEKAILLGDNSRRGAEVGEYMLREKCKCKDFITSKQFHKKLIDYMISTKSKDKKNVLECLDNCNFHFGDLISSCILGNKLIEDYITNPNNLCKRQKIFIKEHLRECKICQARFNTIKSRRKK